VANDQTESIMDRSRSTNFIMPWQKCYRVMWQSQSDLKQLHWLFHSLRQQNPKSILMYEKCTIGHTRVRINFIWKPFLVRKYNDKKSLVSLQMINAFMELPSEISSSCRLKMNSAALMMQKDQYNLSCISIYFRFLSKLTYLSLI